MKLYLTILLLAFCSSGCYSHLQYLDNSHNSTYSSENSPVQSTNVYSGDYQNWQFLGVDYYPYYKDYNSGWNMLPDLNLTYSSQHFTDSDYSRVTSPNFVVNSGYSTIFSNPILVCWNPPVYPSNGYAPSNIPINIGVGIINGGRIKKSTGSNHGPRAIGPDRVRGSQVLPDRTRGTNITKGKRSSAGRSSGSSSRNRSRGN